MTDFKTLFARPAQFLLGVVKEEQLPNSSLPEIAFAGRSNVGKSSLINALFNNKTIAKTSNTPGRTKELNFFSIEDQIYLVDLPGYGFAKASKTEIEKWQSLILRYLQGRVQLKRVFLLIDSRRGIKDIDFEIMKMLDVAAVAYQVILTKTDKISKAEFESVFAKTQAEIKNHAAAFPMIIATSSEKRLGLDELKEEIFNLSGNGLA